MRAIVVFYDSLNRRYLPPYNSNTDVIAPNFERLAKQSVTFNNGFVGSMPCIPARRDLHTGRYNFMHREWGPLEPYDDSCINMLSNSGVYTHLVSDHLHYWEDGGANYHTQYDSWEIVRGQEGDKWKGNVADPEIPEVVRVPCAHSGASVTSNWRNEWVNRRYLKKLEDLPQYNTFRLGCEFIEENKDEDNWLLHVETFDPHEPFYTTEEFLSMYPAGDEEKYYDWPRGKVIETEDEIAQVQRRYKALVSMCDYHLGKIMDEMDKYNMWEDTMLIVGTDHGILLSEHDWWSKNLMPYYDEIANVPLFIWDPRSQKKDIKSDALVQMIDWAPTLLKYFNLDPTKDMMGKDIAPVIENNEKIHDSILYGAHSAQVNCTDGDYTYMRGSSEGRHDHVYNYTLMPSHMKRMFTVDELKDAEYVEPFSFTKGLRLLKVKSNDRYNITGFGTLLYNRNNDKFQLTPLDNEEVESDMTLKLLKLMEEADAPYDLYYRLGLEKHYK